MTRISDCTVHSHFECEHDNVHYYNSNNLTLLKENPKVTET